MQAKFKEYSPAKLNLFLRIIDKRDDGYHNLRSGITLINLFDEVLAEEDSKFKIKYVGPFAPFNNKFDDCIIKKFFSKFNITPPNYSFTIKKNIPVQSGLGSASSNLAAILRVLQKLDYKNIKKNNLASLGADIPFFVQNCDSLVRGVGDIIINKHFPKYFFLLVKPEQNLSTSKMFSQIDYNFLINKSEFDADEINELDTGNDFEKIAKDKFPEIKTLIEFLGLLEDQVFTRLTGSGSCIFTAFENKISANNALENFNKFFPNTWSVVVENNF